MNLVESRVRASSTERGTTGEPEGDEKETTDDVDLEKSGAGIKSKGLADETGLTSELSANPKELKTHKCETSASSMVMIGVVRICESPHRYNWNIIGFFWIDW